MTVLITRAVAGSVDRARWYDTLAALPGYGRDEVEVSVVVQHPEVELLCRRGDQEIGDLPTALAEGGEHSLDLQGPADVGSRRLDTREDVERADEVVPFLARAR